MFGKSKKEKISYGIVGLGRFGYALAVELAASGAELVVLDQDEEKVREIRELTENAYVVKSLDKKTLSETGIQNCDVAVVCIGEHIEPSILTTLNLVDMGVPKVISKATSAEHGEILRRLGAEVVYPERDMAIRLAKRLASRRILDFIQLSEKINITKLESRPIPDSPFEFLFYWDFAGNMAQEHVQRALGALAGDIDYFQFLGNYPELSEL